MNALKKGKEFLNAYFLRPETALWRTADLMVMEDAIFSGKSLDFGCGDGVFSFLRANGKFEDSFDVFQGTSHLDEFYDFKDVYDFDKSDHVLVRSPADYKISVGFDHKQSLLNKAKKLEFYGELIQGDGNKSLPFEDKSFDCIFSNILYWLDDFRSVIAELFRILKPGGSLYVMLPDKQFLASSFYFNYQVKNKTDGYEFLKLLDRGRFDLNFKQISDVESWKNDVLDAGFSISDHKMHLGMTLLKTWDIGLRPLFPALAKACSKMSLEDRLEFKKDLVETAWLYFEPLLKLELHDEGKPKGFHYFHLARPNLKS